MCILNFFRNTPYCICFFLYNTKISDSGFYKNQIFVKIKSPDSDFRIFFVLFEALRSRWESREMTELEFSDFLRRVPSGRMLLQRGGRSEKLKEKRTVDKILQFFANNH